MQVYNNITAFSTWRSYNQNVNCLRQSMNKLSSGLRIARAGDDPAGLAMSERLRAQYRNTAKAASNVENKINYLQTADAWLQKIHDMTGRMAELAVMANDGTKSQVDRDNLQKEFKQMQNEIKRITSGATAAGKFNGLYLFRGGNGVPMMDSDMVEGSTSSQFSIQRISGSASLSHEYQAVYDYGARTWEVRDITSNNVIGNMTANPRDGTELYFSEGGSLFHLKIEPPSVGGYQQNATIDFSQTAMREATSEGMEFSPSTTQGSAGLSVSGSGADISRASWSATYDGSQWVIRNETTHSVERTVSAAANAAISVPFVQGFDGFNLQINTPGNGTCYSIGDQFTWSNQNGSTGNPVFRDASAQNGGASVSIQGDGFNVSTASYRATYDGIHDRWAVVNTSTGATVGNINANPFSSASISLEGGNGFRLNIVAPSSGGYGTGDSFSWNNTAPTADYRLQNNVTLQIGPDSNQVFSEEEINLECVNFDIIGSYAAYSYGSINMTLLGSTYHTVRWGSLLSGQHLSISQQSAAQGAVDKLNLGIDHVSSIRAVVGAEIKRMEETLSGLRDYEENARATESRIRDADIAYETTQYSKYQILVQIGTAMLAQANALPQAVLQMLG